MKPLSIRNALKLYSMIAPYLPEVDENTTTLDFVGTIIQNIIDKNEHHIYIESVALMMDNTVEEIVTNLNRDEILQMFIEGIQDNNLLSLQGFCKKVGWNG